MTMRTEMQQERRKTRTLTVSPWVKGILIAGATSAFLSLPAMVLHAYKTMRSIDTGMTAVKRMAADYNIVVRQNVSLQVQVHRLTDAVNDLRHEKGLSPIEQQTIIGATPAEASMSIDNTRARARAFALISAASGVNK